MPGIQNSKSTLDYLGTIGSNDRGEGLPLNATAKALVKVGEFLILTASDNMDRKKNVATGGTISSMKIVNQDLIGPKMSLEVEINKEYKFLDQGVKGVGGSGQGKYQFKNLHVSKKMATAILRWLRRRGMRAKTYPKKYGAYGTKLKTGGTGKIERKDVKINRQVNEAENFKSLAYAVSASIKKNGIKPTYFFTNAITSAEKKSIELLGEAVRIDIINSVNDKY